jgi:aspartate aminotransferase-like enzyme
MKHDKLFIPGPTEVRQPILEAQAQWLIGHRSTESVDLFERIQNKIRQVFFTDNRVFISASSGTGLQEAAIRNCSDKKILNCVNGAFADRWRRITEANNKDNDVLEIEWGKPLLADQVVQRLRQGGFDAVAIVHNETSTGVTSPIREIARGIREMPGGEDIMILVDSVSGLGGIRVEVDAWDLDVVLTSSQKAFALPPGLAFCSVSDKAMAKAQSVEGRGYYFDFVEMDKYLRRHQTPSTPPMTLLFALDRQLTDMLEEGMRQRFDRHLKMRETTIDWVNHHGMEMFAAAGFESPTVSCIRSRSSVEAESLISFAQSQKMIISNGYGPLKDMTFRIAHMGDTTLSELELLLEVLGSHLSKM